MTTTGTTAQEKKSACFSFGSPIANNNSNINNNNFVNIAGDQMIKDNLWLVLSPNLTNSVGKSQQMATSSHLNNCSIDFVKDEYTKNGDHKLYGKQLSLNLQPTIFIWSLAHTP